MKAGTWAAIAVAAGLIYLLAGSPALQASLGLAVQGLVRPVLIPVVELLNHPAFVYCAAAAILLAGLAACAIYQFTAVRPLLSQLRRVRTDIGDLPQPRVAGAVTPEAWTAARHALGLTLLRHGTFVAGWSAFQAESIKGRGIPGRPFSSFVAAEPGDASEAGGTIRSLPGTFTSVGLILTFVGLVVALYFAAKGFRSGDPVQAKAAIVQLLNAASFKFLTSVSALMSALLISLYGRYGATAIRRERLRTLSQIEGYLSAWRERVGAGDLGESVSPSDLLRRFDALLAGMADIARDVKRLADRDAVAPAPSPVEA